MRLPRPSQQLIGQGPCSAEDALNHDASVLVASRCLWACSEASKLEQKPACHGQDTVVEMESHRAGMQA